MNEKLYKLNKNFQRELFSNLISFYGDSMKASKKVRIPSSSIRAYKNLYSKSVPEGILNYFVLHNLLTTKDLKKNTLQVYKRSEIISKHLSRGRKINHKKIALNKKRIPPIEKICTKYSIDFSKWFKKYFLLFNIGFRKSEYETKNAIIILRYKNYSKGKWKEFTQKFPEEFKVDKEFSYFFGLWCGDRSGGKRFGIINKNREILSFTEKFLREKFQKTEKILYIEEKMPLPSFDYDKLVRTRGKFSGWAISLHSTNGVLSSFFNYLLKNLDFLLDNFLDKDNFFAGLFDAEGNVSLYNGSFRWACKNKELISILKKHLKNMNLYNRYDGANLVTYNKEIFETKIIPYMVHKTKINDALFLCRGRRENLPQSIIDFLLHIKRNPNKTQKEIAKALKKSKVYFQLNLLKKFGYIHSEGYPPKFKLNKEIKNISGD